MKNLAPIPTKSNVLNRLKKHVPVTSIVDVGVREMTPELMHAFPELKHNLFEPMPDFFELIKHNYRDLSFDLYPMALSDKSSELYLKISSLDRSGKPTHSQITETSEVVDGMHILSCSPIQVKRFDELSLADTIEKNYLLKVDVDGKDFNVLQGFGKFLGDASAVIVECTMHFNLAEIIQYLQTSGFMVIDFVDLVYYGDSLYQMDIVLVRKDLLTHDLKPPISHFDRALWAPFVPVISEY